MPQVTIELLKKGLDANLSETHRRGNVIFLPETGELVVAGDIHGHRRNFQRIMSFADLQNNPARHLVLQEIIHGGPEDESGGCLSYKLLLDAVRYKLRFPQQVHIIMGNHDTAFITGGKVMKDGKEMNAAMCSAIKQEFGSSSLDVKKAFSDFLMSQPLVVRTKNKIWISHSLPRQRQLSKFDPEIFNRDLNTQDLVKPGSAYLLTWGRNHSENLIGQLTEQFDVDFFVLGHQPQRRGWRKAGQNLIIRASDHCHGCLLPIDLSRKYKIDKLVDSIVPLASIA